MHPYIHTYIHAYTHAHTYIHTCEHLFVDLPPLLFLKTSFVASLVAPRVIAVIVVAIVVVNAAIFSFCSSAAVLLDLSLAISSPSSSSARRDGFRGS